MAETFLPGDEIGISSGSSADVEARVNIAGFGDGYSQRSGDGINSLTRTYDIVLAGLTKAEHDYVVGFFKTHRGYIAFNWAKPGESTASKWIARRWKVTDADYGVFDIAATFQQVFDN